MSKKDYIAIAHIINASQNVDETMNQGDFIANDLAVYLQQGNKLFDEKRFLAACGVNIGD